MSRHEMRLPTEDRCVVKRIPRAGRTGGAFYRLSWNGYDPEGDIIFPEGALGGPSAPAPHHDDRVASMTRPIVRVSPLGRACRIGYNLDGQFRVELISA